MDCRWVMRIYYSEIEITGGGESELNDSLCSAEISDSEDQRAIQQLKDGMFKFTRGCGEKYSYKKL